jgi:hypothetical protein
MKKQIVLIFIIIFSVAQIASAQQYVKKDSSSGFSIHRMFTGGGLTLALGSEFNIFTFSAGVSPILGYRITDDFAAGFGLQYLYSKDVLLNPTNFSTYPYNISAYGADVFARYLIFEGIFAHVELGEVFYRAPYTFDQAGNIIYTNGSVPDFLIGGGYREQAGSRTAFVIQVLYDVLYSTNNPTEGSPLVIRAGIEIGL